MTKPHLISFDLCPYVQRSVVTLEAKGVPYDVTYIDLTDKPSWFLEISPMAKVPVLRVGDTMLFESDVIAEYLDEVHTPHLHPEDPLQKALHRAWMSFAAGLGGPGYQLMTARDQAAAQRAADDANAKLARLEDQVVGPFFAGEAFQLIDACSASFLQRLIWCDAYAPQLGLFARAPRCRAWADALLAHPAVKASLKPEIDVIFRQYLVDHDAWVAKAS